MTILTAAAQVLRCFRHDCVSLTLTDLVAISGMPKSNASRLLRAMRDAGLLETIGDTKRYRPSLLLLEVARTYARSSTLVQRAHEVVSELSRACGHTGYVSVRDGRTVAAVTDHPGTNALRVASNIGRRLPAAASATGRSLLARLSDAQIRQLYAEGLDPPSPTAPQTIDDLLERLARVRREGYATSHDEAARGVGAIAVAVADDSTGEEASLCIVFPASTTDEAERSAIIAALQERPGGGRPGRQEDGGMSRTRAEPPLAAGVRHRRHLHRFRALRRRVPALTLHKRLTSAEDPSVAAVTGIEEIAAMCGIGVGDIGEMVHGTTLVTNAVIERKGCRLGLITTAGFRDVLEMGREQRYDIYDLFLRFPEPLVSRDLRVEVEERIDADGAVVTALDPAAVEAAAKRLVAAGCEAIAISFLHAYANPRHERMAAAAVARAAPGVSVSISSGVVGEIGEYPRTVTTCANAYVQPLVDRYLGRLEAALSARGFRGSLRLMHSAGGLVSVEAARAYPIRLLESGPAGGGLATALFGEMAGQKDVISFDMGGTTAKACLIENGRAEIAPMLEAGRVHRFTRGSGLPIKTPVIEMIEIGAGGGSIAAIDEVGLLKVGPHSAGSRPGPACYGGGGTKPTVTDANLVLGYYDPGFFLGGRMKLDLEAARRAIATVAEPLGLGIEEAALGIHKVVVESMAAAARVHLVEQGKDPRHYAMVASAGRGRPTPPTSPGRWACAR